MEKLNFLISINAPKEKIWKVLWNDASYREWTSVFFQGSYAKTDNWKEGTEVKFIDSNGNGMVSKVLANKPNEYMSFQHLRELKDGVEDRTSDKVNEWTGAMENYTLKETDSVTELAVDMAVTKEHKDMFTEMWPKALEKIKTLSEQ
ncbi:MAG: SRPBCC domain-containing protein [Flavobacterium sp.]|nr:SRPBCC domain-containing protein [Pedobacter sp.]